MIRVVFFILLIALLAYGEAQLADRPGRVTIEWLDQSTRVSVMTMANAVLATVVAAILLWSLVRAIWRSPALLALFLRNRRSARGHLAVARGLIAVGAGDVLAARRLAQQAARLAPHDPLVLLLAAQSAQLAGDRVAAERAFRAMLGREDTKLFGLHGLYIEAQRRNDMLAARAVAEQAAKTAPALAWAGQAALEFHCSARDWTGALAALERNMKGGLVAKPAYRRQRAVLLTARAMALAESDRATARAAALEAQKLAPELVPAAALAGRLLGEGGETRRAGRMIEDAWRANPHPDLADAFAYLKPGYTARERLVRVQALARKPEGHVEGALAIARAAIDAREFAIARTALAPFVAAPTRRVAMLMAELEEEEHGDVGRAREWMARALNAMRDPAWTADGLVSEKWLPVSPVTGRLDAFEWRVPLAELASDRPVIHSAERQALSSAERQVVHAEPAVHPHDDRDVPLTPAAALAPLDVPAQEHADAPAEKPPEGAAVVLVPPGPTVVLAAPASSAAPVSSAGTAAPSAAPAPSAGTVAVPAPPIAPVAAPAAPAAAAAAPAAAATIVPLAPQALSAAPRAARPPRFVQPIIPLVHAPDDPGPEPEPAPQPAPSAEGWRRLRSLFG